MPSRHCAPPRALRAMICAGKLRQAFLASTHASMLITHQCVSPPCSAYDGVVPARGKALLKTDLAIAVPAGTYGRVGEERCRCSYASPRRSYRTPHPPSSLPSHSPSSRTVCPPCALQLLAAAWRGRTASMWALASSVRYQYRCRGRLLQRYCSIASSLIVIVIAMFIAILLQMRTTAAMWA